MVLAAIATADRAQHSTAGTKRAPHTLRLWRTRLGWYGMVWHGMGWYGELVIEFFGLNFKKMYRCPVKCNSNWGIPLQIKGVCVVGYGKCCMPKLMIVRRDTSITTIISISTAC